MSIVNSDIKFFLSVLTGTAGNQNAQASAAASLGKYISTTEWTGGVSGDLFGTLTGRQNAALRVDHRCLFVKNTHATLSCPDVRAHLESGIVGGSDITIGLDPAGNVAHGASAAQAAQIATDTDSPAGVTFSAPATDDSGLAIGTLAPNECRAIWIRRTALNTGPKNNDGVRLVVLGETAE